MSLFFLAAAIWLAIVSIVASKTVTTTQKTILIVSGVLMAFAVLLNLNELLTLARDSLPKPATN